MSTKRNICAKSREKQFISITDMYIKLAMREEYKNHVEIQF